MTKISGQLTLLYDAERCTGCLMCMIACAFKHYKTTDISKAHIRIVVTEDGEVEGLNCHHCETPLCMTVCPSDAIVKAEETGMVKFYNLRCIGCRSCVYVCPLSMPVFDEFLRVSVKCDLCDGDPECVKFCSPQAIRLAEREQAKQLLTARYGGVES